MKFRFNGSRTKNKATTSLSKGKSRPVLALTSSSDASLSSGSTFSSSSSSSSGSSDETSKYEYGEDTRRGTEYVINFPNEDSSPFEKIAAKYDYGDAPADGSLRSTATPRRSSMKHGEGSNSRLPRRGSISYTGEIEVNLPGKRKPVRRRTSISFCEEDQVNEVVPVKSLTNEPEALWFQDDEYEAMQKKMCSLIDAVQGVETSSTKKYCIRGLEGHFGEGAECKEVSRGAAWDAVLIEQDMQQNEGNFDDEGIAMLYRLSSIESKIKAAQRATQDESEVGHYQRDTRRRMRRMSST
jgi:hypothetical protein